MLHSICQQIWKTQQWPQDWKRSVFIPIPKKGNAKECSNYCTIALISHTSKVMLKILQARLQQYVNRELPDVQAEFRKGRRTRDQIANIHLIMEKAKEFQKKHLLPLYWLCQSPMDWFHTGQGVRQGCILSPCLFNFYAEYIVRNAGLDEAQAGIKIASVNINNLRYAEVTTLMAENKELESILMNMKEQKWYRPNRSRDIKKRWQEYT